MTAYYNENDPGAAIWLLNNIEAGLIAPGHVDTRSIKDVTPNDLKGYAQHHFFAGIGGWSYAARLAGWADDRPLWSASCPCQPFSAAGKGLGADDPRHLWPDLYRLADPFARERRARGDHFALVGEQVAGAAGRDWFDGVRADLARSEILARSVDIPALAVDAPHERNRLYWVALAYAESIAGGSGLREDDTIGDGPVTANCHGGGTMAYAQGERGGGNLALGGSEGRTAHGGIDAGRDVGDAERAGLEGHGRNGGRGGGRTEPARPIAAANGGGAYMVDAASGGRPEGERAAEAARYGDRATSTDGRNGSWWAGADWIACHDGKARRVADARAPLLVDGIRGGVPFHRPASVRVESGPLAEETRFVSRIAAWKGFGNGIVAPLAAEVIAALKDVLPEWRP